MILIGVYFTYSKFSSSENKINNIVKKQHKLQKRKKIDKEKSTQLLEN